jgi:drug/metabolite transporter (DMT)-like permease
MERLYSNFQTYRTYLGLIGATTLWASVFHVSKYALESYSPLTVAAWRYGLAGLIFFALSFQELRAHSRQIVSQGPILVVLALCGVVGFGVSIFFGLRLTSPVNAALIMAFNPSMIIVFSALINREKITAAQVSGLFLGLTGVLVVVTHGSLNALIHMKMSQGDLLIGLAAVFWTIYCVLPKRYVRNLPSAQLSSTTIILAAAMLIPVAFGFAPDIAILPDWKMTLTLLFLAVFGTVIPYLWWNQGVQKLGPAKAGVFMNLVPIFASLMGLALGQHLLGSQLVGAVLVIMGVLITSVKIKLPTADHASDLALCTKG